MGNAWQMNDAKRVSADKRDGEENDFHGLCISPPWARSVSNVTKRKTPLGRLVDSAEGGRLTID
jgi:hypothetical protein